MVKLLTGSNKIIDFSYTQESLKHLQTFLSANKTFEFPRLSTGLFQAANLSDRGTYTGYQNVWVRDNIHIAHAHYVVGKTDIAVRALGSLMHFFAQQQAAFDDIIEFPILRRKAMKRPHIRFNGAKLACNAESWSHAQNDALAYFVWLSCKMALDRQLTLSDADWQVLGRFPLYFNAIEYWQDADSGHWEEAPKIEASSIGVVVAAMTVMQALMTKEARENLTIDALEINHALLENLITQGRQALDKILPHECIQQGAERAYDSALLFLIYPLDIVSTTQADAILQNVITYLQGEFGIRRYLGDSFWCADYDQLVDQSLRTADVSDDMSARDALLKEGGEAQWCVFDPIISVIYGRRYLQQGQLADKERQLFYFQRSLSQLTDADSGFPPYLCPELYFRKGDKYVPNDVTPLLWTQANVMLALHFMEKTLAE